MENEKGSDRRGFLKGLLVAAGATSATMLTAGKALAKSEGAIGSDTSKGPILYRRTEEQSVIIKPYTPKILGGL